MKRFSLVMGLAFLFTLAAGGSARAVECVDELQAADNVSTCCGLGAIDCNGDTSDGCECRPADSCHASECAGSRCDQVIVPNGTYCPDCATGNGICMGGICRCGNLNGPTPMDMSMPPRTPLEARGCDYTQTGTGAGVAISLFALAAFVVFAFRRRRS
jgi:MYXO-CTERM domain-containing protein